MIDLGEYAAPILQSYVISIALILGIIALSIWQQRRVRAEIAKLDSKK